MKRKLVIILLALISAVTFAFSLSACGSNNSNTGKTTEGLEYKLSEDESYYIVSGIGTATDTDIVIADKYNGLPVKAIGLGHSKIVAV